MYKTANLSLGMMFAQTNMWKNRITHAINLMPTKCNTRGIGAEIGMVPLAIKLGNKQLYGK